MSYSEFSSAFTSKPKIPRTPETHSASPRKGKIPTIAPQFSQSGPQQMSRPSSSGSSTRSRQSKWKQSPFCLSALGVGKEGALQELSRNEVVCCECARSVWHCTCYLQDAQPWNYILLNTAPISRLSCEQRHAFSYLCVEKSGPISPKYGGKLLVSY